MSSRRSHRWLAVLLAIVAVLAAGWVMGGASGASSPAVGAPTAGRVQPTQQHGGHTGGALARPRSSRTRSQQRGSMPLAVLAALVVALVVAAAPSRRSRGASALRAHSRSVVARGPPPLPA